MFAFASCHQCGIEHNIVVSKHEPSYGSLWLSGKGFSFPATCCATMSWRSQRYVSLFDFLFNQFRIIHVVYRFSWNRCHADRDRERRGEMIGAKWKTILATEGNIELAVLIGFGEDIEGITTMTFDKNRLNNEAKMVDSGTDRNSLNHFVYRYFRIFFIKLFRQSIFQLYAVCNHSAHCIVRPHPAHSESQKSINCISESWKTNGFPRSPGYAEH